MNDITLLGLFLAGLGLFATLVFVPIAKKPVSLFTVSNAIRENFYGPVAPALLAIGVVVTFSGLVFV